MSSKSSHVVTLEDQGFEGFRPPLWNLSEAVLVEHTLRRGEGMLTPTGALVVRTGKYTGRSPKDRFIVKDSITEDVVDWGAVNLPFPPAHYDALRERVLEYLKPRELYVVDAFGGTDPKFRLPIRVICEKAYHALFAHQLFVRPSVQELLRHNPEFTVIAAPDFLAEPDRDHTKSETFILINFSRKEVLIGGTLYAGEIKKSIFGVLNTILPQLDVMAMHCSANVGRRGDVALFFGLSGTGKTTLSAEPLRHLIGDDEHGWSNDGVFNFEGGCYAKCVRLNRTNEPEIYNAIRFGTILENVVVDNDTRIPDYNNTVLTENTRAAYPIDFIPNFVPSGTGGHPNDVIFLTCDAFGVLPPVSKLTPDQAMYHFLSGYTAKVAGTERGLGNQPAATFSHCFGAPFMTLPPSRYAELLGEKLRTHKAQTWLVNTGWTGGGPGQGQRIALPYTRALIEAIHNHSLQGCEYETDPIFGLEIPKSCPTVPTEILNPRNAWADPAAYDLQAQHLAKLFNENFAKFKNVSPAIQNAGPRI